MFEGADASGKKTQSKMLVKYLGSEGIPAKYIEFPQYDTPFGKLIAKYLRGEFGEMEAIPPEIPAILYAVDRYQFKDDIENWLKAGTYVIANRYSESNLGYQAAKFSGKAMTEFIDWLQYLEGRLPKADAVFYLHLPISISQELIAGRSNKKYLKGETKDIHERDVEYQKRVDRTYLGIARNDPERWHVIKCGYKNGIRDKNEIHLEVLGTLRNKFGFL